MLSRHSGCGRIRRGCLDSLEKEEPIPAAVESRSFVRSPPPPPVFNSVRRCRQMEWNLALFEVRFGLGMTFQTRYCRGTPRFKATESRRRGAYNHEILFSPLQHQQIVWEWWEDDGVFELRGSDTAAATMESTAAPKFFSSVLTTTQCTQGGQESSLIEEV